MRRLMAGVPEAASGSFARRVGLLLLLAASLAGFFLLLNLLSSLVASGPEDILAVNPSEGDKVALPSGVGLLAFCVVAVSVILGIVAFLAPQHRPLRLNIRLSVPLVVGAALAVALIGAGVYLASSGILGQEIPYDQYLVERSSLQPGKLGVLAVLFLSVTIVGILVPRFLVPLLLLFLLVAVAIVLGTADCSLSPSAETQQSGGAGELGPRVFGEEDSSGSSPPELFWLAPLRWALLVGAGLFPLAIILGILRPQFLLLVLLLFLIWLAIGAGLSALFPPDAVPLEGTARGGGPGSAEDLWVILRIGDGRGLPRVLHHSYATDARPQAAPPPPGVSIGASDLLAFEPFSFGTVAGLGRRGQRI